MWNLQTYHFKLDFQKVDQHTGGKWLIHGTKRRKDNQLQSLELTQSGGDVTIWGETCNWTSWNELMHSIDLVLSGASCVASMATISG